MTSSNPSVLFIGNFLSGLGGRLAPCEELADRLRKREWEIRSSSSRRSKVLRLAGMVSTCFAQASAMDVAHVDVFSGSAFFWAEASCWALRRSGCPYILTLHGGNLPAFSRRWPRRVRALLQSAAAVTAPSGYLVEALRPFRPDIVLLPNAIDVAAYPYRIRESAQPELVWLRAFHRIYNPTLAPRVVAGLVEQFPDIHLTMIGPDKDGSLAETKETAEKLNVLPNVTFIPGVPKHEVPSWLDRAGIFLNTTNIDNMPVTMVEAMVCGLCVVSTNVGGVPYIVDHGRTGLLTPPGDVEAMVSAVTEILSNPALAHRLSSAARMHAEQFDWPLVLAQWQDLFTSIQSGRPRIQSAYG